MFNLNYRKLKPLDLKYLAKYYEDHVLTDSDKQHNYNPFSVSEIQSYIPLYKEFFVLNDTNYNKIGLNNVNNVGNVPAEELFIKCAPLVDTYQYLIGKCKLTMPIRLPSIRDDPECLPKLQNKNNMSYVDGFFCYLSGQLKHTYNMHNAIDFYGSYLAVQNVFKANVTDELEYLYPNEHFQNGLGTKFTVSVGDDMGGSEDNWSRSNKKPLQILEEENADMKLDIDEVLELSGSSSPLSSSVSSRTHHSAECEYLRDDVERISNMSSESDSESDSDSESEREDTEEDKEETKSSTSSRSNIYDIDEEPEEEQYAYIKNFPSQLIFLEKCEETFNHLFLMGEMDVDRGAAALMQVIMTLIAFQKAFQFTHNDLHTHNIMYVRTDAEYLFYKFNGQFYRVPTYGYIFKIIDFGRAIYRYNGNIYCSDCFAPHGDAYLQYNTEPFFNGNNRRVDCNYSFDLCRLGCSIYDMIIRNETDPRDEFQETIFRWCLDDSGKNVMYRKNGEERYPGFKLYKMIARNVHNHTPQEQLKYPLFSQFRMCPQDASQLDEATVRKYGLNIDTMHVYA